MNRDVLRARELLVESAARDLDRLCRMASGEKLPDDPQQVAARVEDSLRMLVRVPAEVVE